MGSLHKIQNVVSHELTLRKSPELPCGLNKKKKGRGHQHAGRKQAEQPWQTQLVCTRAPADRASGIILGLGHHLRKERAEESDLEG